MFLSWFVTIRYTLLHFGTMLQSCLNALFLILVHWHVFMGYFARKYCVMTYLQYMTVPYCLSFLSFSVSFHFKLRILFWVLHLFSRFFLHAMNLVFAWLWLKFILFVYFMSSPFPSLHFLYWSTRHHLCSSCHPASLRLIDSPYHFKSQ